MGFELEQATTMELNALKVQKDDIIFETKYMGEKFGASKEMVDRQCKIIEEQYRVMVEQIHNNP